MDVTLDLYGPTAAASDMDTLTLPVEKRAALYRSGLTSTGGMRRARGVSSDGEFELVSSRESKVESKQESKDSRLFSSKGGSLR
jgi:hypothetical protein